MVPLIDKSLYQKLVNRRAEMGSAGVCDLGRVFVPIGPAFSDPMPIRLLFVGQAEEQTVPLEADFDRAVETSIGVVETEASSPDGWFWPAVWKVLDEVLELTGAPVERHQAVGWSELVKIGKADGRPEVEEIAKQADLCIEALQLEIRTFRPDATILLTGEHYARDEILYRVFGREGFRNNVRSKDQVAVKNHPELGVVLWTDHPRLMGKNYPADLGFISGYAAALARA